MRAGLLPLRQGRKKQKNPVKTAIQKLKKGDILAIKGVGGIHLACRAEDDYLRPGTKKKEEPAAAAIRSDDAT